MNMLVKAAEVECRGPLSRSGVRQSPIRAYMDDLTVTTTSVMGGRWLLKGLERNMTWARMYFKPAKSRSLVLKKGKIMEKVRLTVAGETIPTLSEKPIKSLGKTFNSSLKDTAAKQKTIKDLEEWLTKIDKSGLPGRFKAWLFQHAVLPRILWPLIVYDIPITTVESLERAISNRLRRWLGLPRCLSGAALYGNSNALRLPCSSLVEEFKITKARELLQYTESEDPKVAAAGIQIRSGRKWSARRELQVAEESLRHKDILGSIAKGRAGLGFFPSTHTISAKGKERRHLILEKVREGVEEGCYGKMVGLSQQGARTRWEDVEKKSVTWSDCWRPDFNEIRFLIKSVYDVLPSPTNLHIWGKIETPNCQLCPRKGSLQHILSSCPKALGDGRYRWRHDQVLKVIANEVTKTMRASKHQPGKLKQINFVKPGEKIQRKRREKTNLLSSADDWQLTVDLETQLKFPRHIAVTSLRPDLILHSDNTKQCIIWELTVS